MRAGLQEVGLQEGGLQWACCMGMLHGHPAWRVVRWGERAGGWGKRVWLVEVGWLGRGMPHRSPPVAPLPEGKATA